MTRATMPATADGVAEKNLDPAFDLMEAALEDPDLLAGLPKDAAVVLMPDDDPEQFAANIEVGLAALRRVQDVYFRHVATQYPGQ